MSKQGKLLAKLLNKQSTFTWQELATLLKSLGYRQIIENLKSGGLIQ
ncbi:HicA protein [Marinobacter sp. P4B1]|nr:HicA protein [Marinobacter sp. P4B1]